MPENEIPSVHGITRQLRDSRICMYDFPTDMLRLYPNVIHNIYKKNFTNKPLPEELEDYEFVFSSPTNIELKYDFTTKDCMLRIHPVQVQYFIDVRMNIDDMRFLYDEFKTFFGDK